MIFGRCFSSWRAVLAGLGQPALLLDIPQTWSLIVPLPAFQSSWQNWKNTKGRRKRRRSQTTQTMEKTRTSRALFCMEPNKVFMGTKHWSQHPWAAAAAIGRSSNQGSLKWGHKWCQPSFAALWRYRTEGGAESCPLCQQWDHTRARGGRGGTLFSYFWQGVAIYFTPAVAIILLVSCQLAVEA